MANWYVDGEWVLPAFFTVTTANNSAGATLGSGNVTIPSGSLIIVVVSEATATTNGTMADAAGNTYTVGASGTESASAGQGMIFYAYNSAALTAQAITYTKAGSGHATSMTVSYLTGMQTGSDPRDSATAANASGTSASPSVTSGTPGSAGLIMVGALTLSNGSALTYTAAAPTYTLGTMTGVTTQATAQSQGQIMATPSIAPFVFAPTLSGTATGWVALVVGFKVATVPAGHWGVAQWAPSHVYAAGSIVRQLAIPGIGSERCFRTAAGGTSAGSEPAWNLAQGSSQPTDNTITDWTECTGAEARQSGGNWAAPAARLNTATFVKYVSSIAVNNQGTSGTYAVNDVLTLVGGTTYGDAATFTVSSVSAGKVTAVTIRSGGSYSTATGASGIATTGGGGSGCTLNPTYTNWSAATDTFYVKSTHAETQPTALTIQSQATTTNSQPNILCVSGSNVPPVSGDLTTGATVQTTGNLALTLNNLGYVYGVTFTCGNGANSPTAVISGIAGVITLESCAVRSGGTNASIISLVTTPTTKLVLNNTTFQVGNASTVINCVGGSILWKNTPSAITGSTVPTTLFSIQAALQCMLDGVDLSALGSGKSIQTTNGNAGQLILQDCKLGASVTVAAAPTSISGARTDLIRCDSGATTYRQERYWFEGTLVQTTSIVRTGGASDGTTQISWQITTTANTAWWHPFECFQIGEWNATTGSNVTCTVYGVINASAVPNNDDVWLDIEYLGSASSPQASFASGTKANILASGSAQTADTSAWDTMATVRANSHSYSLGDIIAVSSNAGRIFFCTSAGTSSGSLPAAYASAVDGGSVTDGGATFRAGCRFKMATVLSAPQPQLAGSLYGIVRLAKASSTVFIDPLLTLS